MCSEDEFSLNTVYALMEAKKYERMCFENPRLYARKIDQNELESIMSVVTYNQEHITGYLAYNIKTYGDLISKLREISL